MRVLPKGTKYSLSEIGHKNFLYPIGEDLTLQEDLEVDLLPYISGSMNYSKAFKVLGGPLKGKVIWT